MPPSVRGHACQARSLCFQPHQESCRVLAPWPGFGAVPPAWRPRVLTAGQPGKPLSFGLFLRMSFPPLLTEKETVPEVPPLLFSDEEEKAAQSGVKPAAKKAESAKGTSELGRTVVKEPGKVDSFFSCIICGFCLSDVLVKPVHVRAYPYIFLPQKMMTQLLQILRTLKARRRRCLISPSPRSRRRARLCALS